jgi:hypothetical protein
MVSYIIIIKTNRMYSENKYCGHMIYENNLQETWKLSENFH